MHTDVYTQMLRFFKIFLEAFSSEVWPEGSSGTASSSEHADLAVLVINLLTPHPYTNLKLSNGFCSHLFLTLDLRAKPLRYRGKYDHGHIT